jgi:hypothetical protein
MGVGLLKVVLLGLMKIRQPDKERDMSLKLSRRGSAIAMSLVVSILCFVSVGLSQGQTFNSGSTGSDGALNLTTPGTIIFDPKSFNPPLDPAGDNVYNFTTINIASGVTVKLTSKTLSGPVYWLAQGPVTINGVIDLNGDNGHPDSNLTAVRVPAAGGAGGFSGGVGGTLVAGNSNLPAPQSGNGPGGGLAPTAPGAAHGGNGAFTGSQFLIPLIGGSGGAGGSDGSSAAFGGGGSGGGGAILIASSVSITYGGIIRANGGGPGSLNSGSMGGAGSGGAIRLIAPTISDISPGDTSCAPFGHPQGLLQATGSAGTVSNNGIIRLEAFDLTNVNIADCVRATVVTSTPLNVAPPATAPSLLKVTNINGIPINANPFSFPDVIINSSGPVTVNVQAQYIPVGIVPKIIVTSETGSDQTVNCSPLAGTLQQSTCSASITFPTGGSRGFVKATWTQ